MVVSSFFDVGFGPFSAKGGLWSMSKRISTGMRASASLGEEEMQAASIAEAVEESISIQVFGFIGVVRAKKMSFAGRGSFVFALNPKSTRKINMFSFSSTKKK